MRYGGFPKLGVLLKGGPHNKDYSILGSKLGSPLIGNYHTIPASVILHIPIRLILFGGFVLSTVYIAHNMYAQIL